MELFQSIAEAISLYRYIFWPLLALMTLVLVFIRWWDQVSYFFLNLMSSLPLIGHVSRLSRANEPRRQGTGKLAWYPAEEAICAKYWQYYKTSNLDADFYLRCVNYLNKVDERGRKPTGVILWGCSVVLVLLEAFIFALVLSPFIASNISANQAEFSAIVISVLIGVVLVPATHLMGSELHKNTLLKKIRYWYSEARHSGSAKGLSKNHEISLENTRLDDNDPNYIQMLNRVTHNVHVKPQYWATAVALALIIFFSVGAYLVRAATINAMDTQAVNGSPFSQVVQASDASPFDLPAGAAADNARADTQASQEITDNRVFASKLTFIILSVIFVGVQLIGILIGIYRSFAGIESKAAAKYIGNFSGSEEFASWHAMRRERVERDGQEKLTALQNRLMMKRTNGQSEPLTTLPTFDDYISGKLRDKARSNAELNAHLQATSEPVQPKASIAQPVVQPIESVPVEAVSQPVAPVQTPPVVDVVSVAQPVAAPASTAEAETDDEKQRIHELGDLTLFSEEELQLIADDLGLPLASLQKRQRVQALLNKARPKENV
ncbi:hypothetical protein ABRP70_03230 [Pectobacterium odoriferum]|uniref:Rho termination factor N-terminal domain-containing protein n=1 Tax=Pectobacterium odoriferum TaxID=78398 RepID=A0ABD6VW59_9GAMM|nr:hypothetical protein [Pectobacterium odoriferum]AIU87123.1 hypothetical protein BCS7_02160 [Pectobacterium odoriferum]KGA36874.1 hypothetical protein KS43_11410 [Pectobacterium odoriferum]KGA41061.1 hypothetical protein KU75_13945 [Pectobacterium odoriferum]MBA0189719.1 hypothetical protein [Pectobacterium odoriferum]POD94133.1 hypothetical protein BV925_06390 [Pectobacterium odoriferum]